MRTLIIEDDPSVRDSITLILKSQGHDCDIAETGAQGLDLAKQSVHDIVLLDLSLPDMNGHEVLRQLRGAHIRTPVLILSGSSDRQDKVKGLVTGADDYVTKPFDKEELLARIRAIVRRATGRTPPSRAASLDGGLLAKRGQAEAWSFTESYTAPAAPASATDHSKQYSQSEPALDSGASEISESAPRVTTPVLHTEQDTARPHVIVFGNGKGGTGKSTLAMHLIAAFLAAGQRVGSIDCDAPQHSLSRYLANRKRFAEHTGQSVPLPAHVPLGPEDLSSGAADEKLRSLAEQAAVVIVDTPGHDTPLSRWAHAQADLLVTPINDSFVDLDVLAEMSLNPVRILRRSHYCDLALAARQSRLSFGKSMQWLVLRNRLAHMEARNRKQISEALATLAADFGFTEGPGLRERVIYRELFLSGLTLTDLPRRGAHMKFGMSHVAARQELRSLLEAVQESLKGAAENAHEDALGEPQASVAGGHD
jgi:chromosome partitioning protein